MTNDQKQQIQHLRQMGLGYTKIARKINLTVNTVKSFCYRNPINESLIMTSCCKQCGKPVEQNIKHKEKKFCSNSCCIKCGEQWHTAAYGYRWDGKTFVINEEEAVAIRRIYDNFLKDIPMRQTAKWLEANGYACSISFVCYVLQNPVYVGDVVLQRYFTENHRTHKIIKNEGQLPRYYIRDNHPAIIDRAIFDKVQEKIKANYDFNPAVHRMVKPSCFSAKIICGNCGTNYVKGMTRTNRHDGLVEHWYCYGKIRRRNCKAKNIRVDRLRKACCEVLDLEEFDEEIFGKTIDKILVTDKLEFHFYDGTVKTVQIQFFKKGQGRYTDPHKKPFGYQWSNEKGYVIVPKEAEVVKLIFRYYLEGWQITGISKELEAEGYGSIRGRISRKLVAYVLDSDFYLGIRRIKAQFSESGKEEVIENDHEPIISREDGEFVGLYSDEGISGCNTKKREGFRSMVQDALDGKIELIIANIKPPHLIQYQTRGKTSEVLAIRAFEVFCCPVATPFYR